MSEFIPEILEERVVAQDDTGAKMAWYLETTEDGKDHWVPKAFFTDGTEHTPVWLPLPGSQYLFLECPIYEALYEGTRGPGKTLTLIMDFCKDVGKGYGKLWRGVLFRRTFGDLDDVVNKIDEWLYKIYPGFKFLKSKAEYAAVWPTGEQLLLRHMKDETDYQEYHGHEYPWIGWEELTAWETDKAYNLMMSCNRAVGHGGIPCRIRATTNPYGPGHNWVKRRFQLPQMRGKVVRKAGEMPRVAIHGNLSENFLLLHDHAQYPLLIRQAAMNPAQEQAWLEGRWDVTAGGMIDDIWTPKLHILPVIPLNRIPKGWKFTRAYDHGSARPFSVGWFLESNGEPMEINGRLIGNVKGDIILWDEWYGTNGEDNTGVYLAARKIGEGIRDREIDMGLRSDDGFAIQYVTPGPADSELFNRQADRDGKSSADDMEDEGVMWERADKSAGSIRRGWDRMRTMLVNAIPEPDGLREHAGFFVCENCYWWIETVPPTPRDPDDPDVHPKNYEDHASDMTRYRLSWEPPVMWRKPGF
jgi:hypothetical protein